MFQFCHTVIVGDDVGVSVHEVAVTQWFWVLCVVLSVHEVVLL